MKRYCRVYCLAQRGRGDNNTQRYEMRIDKLTSSLTSVQKDNYIFTINTDMETKQANDRPTKEQLIAYFGDRIKVRKITPREAFRLMDVSEEDIDKIQNVITEIGPIIDDDEFADDDETPDLETICKTAQYRLAGNSIVVSCLYHIFRTLFIPDQPENRQPTKAKQLTIFDVM